MRMTYDSRTTTVSQVKYQWVCYWQWRRSVLRIGGTEERPKARRAEAGVRFLGRGQLAPSSPARELGSLGERCKLPQWGPGQSPGRC